MRVHEKPAQQIIPLPLRERGDYRSTRWWVRGRSTGSASERPLIRHSLRECHLLPQGEKDEFRACKGTGKITAENRT